MNQSKFNLIKSNDLIQKEAHEVNGQENQLREEDIVFVTAGCLCEMSQ